MNGIVPHGIRPPGWIILIIMAVICIGIMCLFGCCNPWPMNSQDAQWMKKSDMDLKELKELGK